ncbi:MAG: DUF503 domain-containing protein [candidate division Zixibacteria bacterium]|nr:DUF503 domain-containing protein [candidate division Zixibacteria bacterium]
MVVGICSIEIHIPESNSLKSKRQVLRRLKDRINNRFNVSIAEIGNNDLWQRTTLGVAAIANDGKFINQLLSQVIEQLNRENGVVVMDYSMEIR